MTAGLTYRATDILPGDHRRSLVTRANRRSYARSSGWRRHATNWQSGSFWSPASTRVRTIYAKPESTDRDGLRELLPSGRGSEVTTRGIGLESSGRRPRCHRVEPGVFGGPRCRPQWLLRPPWRDKTRQEMLAAELVRVCGVVQLPYGGSVASRAPGRRGRQPLGI